jgi:hypothetical protein
MTPPQELLPSETKGKRMLGSGHMKSLCDPKNDSS